MSILIAITLNIAVGWKLPVQQVAFCLSEGSESNIHVIGVNGSDYHEVIVSPTGDIDPKWSPDGSTLLFTRRDSDNGHLYTVKPDGSQLTQLTSGNVYDNGDWSPDGRRIEIYRQAKPSGHFVLDLATHKISLRKALIDESSKSPKQDLYIYIKSETGMDDDHRSDIWQTTSPTKPGRRLTQFKTSFGDLKWSPNGKEVAFKMELPPGEKSGDALCILTVHDWKIRTIRSGHNNHIEYVSWSPDGKALCFTEGFSNLDEHNARFNQVKVISRDGKGLRSLTNTPGNNYTPLWTRDGSSLVVQSDSGAGRSSLLVIDVKSGKHRFLETPSASHSISLSP